MASPELVVPYVLAYFTRKTPTGTQILLSLRTASASFGAHQYAMIGGKIDKDESPTQALIREVYEETGCRVEPKDTSVCQVLYFKGHTQVCMALTFRVEHWQGDPSNQEPEKHEEIGWFSVDELPSNLLVRHAFIIKAIEAGTAYAEWGF